MEHTFYRPTWIEIDLNAIKHNIRQMMNILPNESKIMAVVKADGYGHGIVQIARTAIKSGASALAVALLEEAILLRNEGIQVPILVLSWVSPKFAYIAANNNITLTVFQKNWIEELETTNFQQPLNIHLKLDTGMSRIGIRNEYELKDFIYALKRKSNIYLTGVFTHFATADEEDLTYFYKQKKSFEHLLDVINRLWKRPLSIHMGNSAAAIRFPKDMQHYVRYGISMYGLYPSKFVKDEKSIELKSSFSLHSQLIHVKKIQKGEFVGYGINYVAEEDEWVGTLPIGYGDGWIRKLQGFSVLINGKRQPIIGRICMDQTMVKLDKEYEIGEKVTLIGEQDGETIKMEEVANYLETINYEIPCMLNNRIPRIYRE